MMRKTNLILICASCILTLYGLTILFSASQPLGPEIHLFRKQVLWAMVAVGCWFFLYRIQLDKLQRYSIWIAVITLILLVVVLIPKVGVFVNGTRRWISLGGMRLQPSEPAKIGFVIFFSYFLANYVQRLDHWFYGFIRPLMVLALYLLTIMLEPDFGTAFLFGTVGIFLLFLRGLRLRFIVPTAVCALLLFALIVYFNPVRLKRITAFLDLEGNRLTGAYQLWQSLIAFSTGQWSGVGLGQGRQQYFFLPEAHTDFILAVLAEELGVWHVLIVLLCFAAIAWAGLRITKMLGDPFFFFIGMGSICFLIFQVFLNVGVVTGLLPTKGIALPFLSYGGSNLCASFAFIGLLMNLGKHPYGIACAKKEKLEVL